MDIDLNDIDWGAEVERKQNDDTYSSGIELTLAAIKVLN